MRKIFYLLTALCFLSCEKDYKKIDEIQLKAMVVKDTLVKNMDYAVLTVGTSVSDEFPKLLVKNTNLYLFEHDSELENDSIIRTYYPAFVIDDHGSFRKNGIWVYTEFYTEGTFPFHSNVIEYSVDSIPRSWNKELPTQEGIYFYENNALTKISEEQSEEKFKEKEQSGFYFIPNKGRLFNKLNIKQLD